MENISIEPIKTVKTNATIEYFKVRENENGKIREDIIFRVFLNGEIFFEGAFSEEWVKDTPISKLFKGDKNVFI